METMSTYERSGEWSGFTIRPSEKGWIKENWSRISGTTTNAKILIPYSPDFPHGTDLSATWNQWMDLGMMLSERTENAKILRKGHIVF